MSGMLPVSGHLYVRSRVARFFAENPMGMGVLLLLVLAPAAIAYLRFNIWIPALVQVCCGLFLLHVMRVFVGELVEDESHPVVSGGGIDVLSNDIVRHLRATPCTAGSLAEAAARSARGAFLLGEIGSTPQAFLAACAPSIEKEVDVAVWLHDAWAAAQGRGETRLGAPDLLAWLCTHVPACQDGLEKAGIMMDALPGLLSWEQARRKLRAGGTSAQPRSTAIGRSWASGYTKALDLLTRELSLDGAARGEKAVTVHEKEIASVLRILSRPQQHSVLLLGPTGVGKRRLVENAMRALRDQEYQQNLPFTRALVLNTEQLLSGTADADGKFLTALAKAQRAGKLVLIVQDLAILLRASDARLQGVLQRCLQMANLSLVGIVDIRDYHAVVKAMPAIDNLLEKVAVDSVTEEEAMRVLTAYAFTSSSHAPRLTFKAARAVLDLSKRYLAGQGGFPGIALRVYEDALACARERADHVILEEDVRRAVSLKAKMDVQKMSSSDKDRLINLEGALRKRIAGQEAAVVAVSNALKRARLDLHERKKPLGTFLFLGPTGVGKTHTAKALAEEYFGSSDALIRLDMNEYSQSSSVFDIVGSKVAGGEQSFLAQRVQDKPFSLILLDEIEKAHPSVLNLFLQILDEGVLTDAQGIKTNFRNTIIIATSNAGALFINNYVKEHPQIDLADLKAKLIEELLKEKIFVPEFLNRFDEVICFQPLSAEEAKKIALLMLGEILGDIHRKRGLTVDITPELMASLVAQGYNPAFGAREMFRTITTKVEDAVANYLLTHEVKRGDKLELK